MIQTFRSKLEFYSLEELVRDILETTGYVCGNSRPLAE